MRPDAGESWALFMARRKPVPFTREELRSASEVRTILGWYKIVEVNAITVSVDTRDSGD